MKLPSLIICHSQEAYLKGLVHGIEDLEVSILNSTTNGVRALRWILREKPDFVIIEAQFEELSAYEIIKEVTLKKLKTKFILIFPNANYRDVILARSLKIAGCFYAGESLDAIQNCVTTVLEGKVCFSRSISKVQIADKALHNLDLLSDAEINVLMLINVYKSSAKIAEKLSSSVRTIDKHRSNIINKLGIQKETHSLMHWALQHNEIIKTLAFQKIS
ncbi:LuxR C-terminal-related transcriptional regulator [Jejudonia soesokkakensis]|uniref:LuxR C-terminal-related transcriptional regulator n=1 Tax=Jejudonia soesokkakensis TaxID=1323432 RepID=A0ABW2MPT3_9FLAO